MKVLITFILTICSLVIYCQTNSKHVYVKPYTKSDGTKVEGHYRTSPNTTNTDNFSTKGNVNPYTGQPGYIPPDNNNLTYTTSNYPATTYTYNNSNSSNNTYTTNNNNFTFKYDLSDSYKNYPSYSTKTITNLRQGMSASSAIIISIPKGETVKIINSSWGDWWEVYYDNQTGYIHKTSISFYCSGASSDFNSYESYPTYKVKSTANLRQSMSANSAIEAILEKDETVNVINSSWGNWWEVSYKGHTGYIYSTSLTK